jgi:mannose-6-phosphate isomerase
MLYPLKFKPVFKDKIWGGDKIRTSLGLDFSPLPNCGEAWIVSGVSGSETLVADGFLAGNTLNEVVEVYMDELVGGKVYELYGDEFPILVKLIDASDWLSIQVHPDDRLAAERGTGRGKTEMWYILDADPGARLISGFNREMNLESYLEFAGQNRFTDMMNFSDVAKGDVFYIPAGRVHALGPGILLAEIQQTSDTTYRVYDWDRTDDKGNARELHTKEALDAFDFSFHPDVRTRPGNKLNLPNRAVTSPYFTTNLIPLDGTYTRDCQELDSFIIYLATLGRSMVRCDEHTTYLSAGEALVIPAFAETVQLTSEGPSTILEVFIP